MKKLIFFLILAFLNFGEAKTLKVGECTCDYRLTLLGEHSFLSAEVRLREEAIGFINLSFPIKKALGEIILELEKEMIELLKIYKSISKEIKGAKIFRTSRGYTVGFALDTFSFKDLSDFSSKLKEKKELYGESEKRLKELKELEEEKEFELEEENEELAEMLNIEAKERIEVNYPKEVKIKESFSIEVKINCLSWHATYFVEDKIVTAKKGESKIVALEETALRSGTFSKTIKVFRQSLGWKERKLIFSELIEIKVIETLPSWAEKHLGNYKLESKIYEIEKTSFTRGEKPLEGYKKILMETSEWSSQYFSANKLLLIAEAKGPNPDFCFVIKPSLTAHGIGAIGEGGPYTIYLRWEGGRLRWEQENFGDWQRFIYILDKSHYLKIVVNDKTLYSNRFVLPLSDYMIYITTAGYTAFHVKLLQVWSLK